MATWLNSIGDWNTNVNAGIFGGKNAAEVMKQASGFGKAMGGLGINASNIGGIANTIGQIGTGLLAGQNQTGVGNALQTIGGLASNIPGVGGLIGAGVGVVGGLVNAAFGSHINEEFVQQTQLGANQVGSQVFNANTNGDLLNDWQNMTQMSNVSKSEVGSDGWFSNKASRKTRELNRQIDEANQRQLANFNIAAQNVDTSNDLRILQNMAAYGGPINSFRKYYSFGGPFGNYFEGEGEQSNSMRSPHVDLAASNPWLYAKLHPSKKTKKAYKPTTFAGRVSQIAGANELGQKYVDYTSSVLQQIPVVGLGISALDLGYDINNLYHTPSWTTAKDVGLDAASLLPALRKTMKGWWMKGNSGSFITEGGQVINNPRVASSLEVMLQPYRNAVNAGIYTGRAADFLDDSSAYLKEMWDHSPIGKTINEHSEGGYLSQAKALIRQNEGWREKPYKDAPKGKNWRSVGYGFNDSGFREKYPEGISKHYEHGITKKQAEEELDYFLNKAEKQLKSIYGKQWNDFTDSQKAAILDTYYQRPASVAKGSRFYKAVTAGEDAGRYLGVAGYDRRNKIRQDIFGGDYSGYSDTESNHSALQEVTPFTPVVHDLDLSGITPTEAKTLELDLTSPTFDLSMFGKPMTTPTQQAVPTVGTVEDFLASYGNFEQNLFGSRLNNEDMNIFDFGGGLTHGADWDTGLDFVSEGGFHSENPFGGVMVGQDEEGVPNLVEEGEYIWNNDYVFSRRMKVPKKLREKYGLKDDATFADAVAKLTKESEERPMDAISRNTQEHILGELADSQEELRAVKAQRAMEKEQQLQEDFLTGVQFGLGGTLFADGGGIHIDPSKRGTFKAQASKMGMGVQEAASHILANKEDYSPAMVKKANFARNSSKWHEDGGFLFDNSFAYGGAMGNIFAGEGDRPNTLNLDAANQSLVRHIFGDTGFTRFMENAAEAINDPLGYFAGDEINAVIDKLGKMSEPQLEKFFRTDIGKAIAPYLAGDDNSQAQEAGMRGAKSVANIVRRVQRPVQIAAKRAMAQSKQVARGQMKTPKGGGKQKVLTEASTPVQSVRQATTGSTEGLPQGWNLTRSNTPTMTTESIVQGPNVRGARFSGRTTQTSRVNPKSTTGRAATSRGTTQDPYAGLEGTLNMRTPIGSGNFGYLPWAAGIGAGGYGLYKGIDWMADNLTNTDGTISGVNDPVTQAIINSMPSEATSNKGTNKEGKAAVSTPPVSTIEEKLTKNGKKSPSSSSKTLTNSSTRGIVEIPPLSTEMENLTDIFGSAPAIDNSLPEQGMVVFDPKIMGNPDAMAKGTRTTTTDENGTKVTRVTSDGTGLERSPFKPKQTWTRYAPLVMSGLMGLKEMLTPADYGNADAIMAAAYQAGSPVSIGTEYIGDYRKRDPFDERYLMNIINQRGAATNRNMMNLSGGNRAVAMAGILSNDLTTQMSLAEAARQSYLANRADDAQVAEFNRGTNQFNATAQNQRNQFLAGLNSQRQHAMLSGISQGARLRQAIKDQRDAAISANLTNLAQGLGDLGKENGYFNMLGGLNEEGVLKYFYGNDWRTMFNNING